MDLTEKEIKIENAVKKKSRWTILKKWNMIPVFIVENFLKCVLEVTKRKKRNDNVNIDKLQIKTSTYILIFNS